MKKIRLIFLKIVIVVGVIIVFFVININLDSKRKSSFKMFPNSGGYAYQIENLTIDDGELVIEGWFFELRSVRNVDRTITENPQLGVILFDLNTKPEYDIDGNQKLYEGINTEVSIIDRKDVNEYFQSEYDYLHCGFIARVKMSDIDIYNVDYQIIFKLDEENKIGIASELYILNGKLSHVLPEDYFEINTHGTDLEEIVNDGVCLASSTEAKVSVYQYEWKLYWITTNDSFLENDNNTFIEYQLDTTQFEKLPQKRTDGGSYWDSIGEPFEKNEITKDINCGEYRVSVRNIPKEYSVTRILTGYYVDGSWIWQKYLRPEYTFE